MPVADIAHDVGRTVLLVIGMQDEKDIQRVFEGGVRPRSSSSANGDEESCRNESEIVGRGEQGQPALRDFGRGGGDRTHDLRLKRPLLYH